MQQRYSVTNDLDDNGNPAGGRVYVYSEDGATLLEFGWQNGPLGRGPDRVSSNGLFVETLLAAVADRIKHYQSTKFACRENAVALTHIETALLWLDKRTRDREVRGVEGTHEQ